MIDDITHQYGYYELATIVPRRPPILPSAQSRFFATEIARPALTRINMQTWSTDARNRSDVARGPAAAPP